MRRVGRAGYWNRQVWQVVWEYDVVDFREAFHALISASKPRSSMWSVEWWVLQGRFLFQEEGHFFRVIFELSSILDSWLWRRLLYSVKILLRIELSGE